MMKLTVCIAGLSLLAATSEAHRSERSRFEQIWERHEIVPDSIDEEPSQFLEVHFPSGKRANLGNELTPTEVKGQPYLSWDADEDALYTLTATSLDAPSLQRHNLRQVQHWMVVNIPGKKIGQGQIVYDYLSPGPPKGTCLHRYVLLIFKQTRRIHTDSFYPKTSLEGRIGVDNRRLIKEFELYPKPVAGNFFEAQYDDYVPIVQASFGGVPPYEEERSCPY